MFNLLLVVALLMTGYVGPIILRRFGPRQRSYGLMVVGSGLLALVSLLSRSSEGANPIGDTMGVIGIGTAFCLIVLPQTIRDLSRRAMAANRLSVARFLMGLREVLQPGMGAKEEAEVVEAVIAVRQNREQEVIDRLLAQKKALKDPQARRIVEERIIMMYLYAHRWADAVLAYEQMRSLSGAIGSPQLVVEMVRAYCEECNVDAAAELVQFIDESPLAKEPVLVGLVARAHMVFLAALGRTKAVEAIAGPGGPLAHMHEGARRFWSGIARRSAGDMTGARTAFADAVRLSADEQARTIAQAYLDRTQGAKESVRCEVSPATATLADKLTAHATNYPKVAESSHAPSQQRLPRLVGVPLRQMPVTALLVVGILLSSLAVYVVYGDLTDLGALIAAGANLKSATTAGDWWRLGTSIFLHMGVAHLALNAYGMWVLGRFVEQIYGSLRMFVVFLVAAGVGSVASTFLGSALTSLGASSGVLGLMGAAVAELLVYRKRYPTAWARPLLRVLIFLTAAQVAVGFFYDIVDQWGHLGGLLGGALLGLILSRHAPLGRLGQRIAAGGLLAVTLLSCTYVLYGRLTHNYADTLRAYGTKTYEVRGLRVTVPGSWEKTSDGELLDYGVLGLLDLQRVSPDSSVEAVISERIRAEREGGVLRTGFDVSEIADTERLRLPEPWVSKELLVSVRGSSGTQHHRLIVFGRATTSEIWVGAYYHPAALSRDVEEVFAEVVASIQASETTAVLGQ